jgi:hypothetical protein
VDDLLVRNRRRRVDLELPGSRYPDAPSLAATDAVRG